MTSRPNHQEGANGPFELWNFWCYQEEEAEAHYEGFSNSSIWPLLHYLPNYLRYEPSWWEHYQRVNQRFADKVLETAHEAELIWVHDYQLMLLPALLKAMAPQLRVGFFLHTPFPAHEIFRCHPHGRELVAGMLGADLIGFHTFGYLRHFSGSVQRLMGIENSLVSVQRVIRPPWGSIRSASMRPDLSKRSIHRNFPGERTSKSRCATARRSRK